jgi:hypothetical protein
VFLSINSEKKRFFVFDKIKESVGAFHKSGMMHQIVGQDVGKVFH